MQRGTRGSFPFGTAQDDPMLNFDEPALAARTLQAYCVDPFEYPNRKGAVPEVNVTWEEAKRCMRCSKAG